MSDNEDFASAPESEGEEVAQQTSKVPAMVCSLLAQQRLLGACSLIGIHFEIQSSEGHRIGVWRTWHDPGLDRAHLRVIETGHSPLRTLMQQAVPKAREAKPESPVSAEREPDAPEDAIVSEKKSAAPASAPHEQQSEDTAQAGLSQEDLKQRWVCWARYSFVRFVRVVWISSVSCA